MAWRERIAIALGDISEAETEAVVNAANSELWMGSGVAGALKRAGGASIEQEAVRQGPVNVGESVITGAGNLWALHVIHAAAMSPGRPATPEGVAAATKSALLLALDHDIDSISFPALGTGVGGLSLAACAEAMLGTVKDFCREFDQPGEIRFVLFGDNARDAFEMTLLGMED
jgi:O-acetyl-ADP-ribose deacetylase (regulator of RNase III)